MRNALNDRSAEHDVAGITGKISNRSFSRTLSPVFLKQSCSLIRAPDENSRTFSARLPESRRRFCKIQNAGEAVSLSGVSL